MCRCVFVYAYEKYFLSSFVFFHWNSSCFGSTSHNFSRFPWNTTIFSCFSFTFSSFFRSLVFFFYFIFIFSTDSQNGKHYKRIYFLAVISPNVPFIYWRKIWVKSSFMQAQEFSHRYVCRNTPQIPIDTIRTHLTHFSSNRAATILSSCYVLCVCLCVCAFRERENSFILFGTWIKDVVLDSSNINNKHSTTNITF